MVATAYSTFTFQIAVMITENNRNLSVHALSDEDARKNKSYFVTNCCILSLGKTSKLH